MILLSAILSALAFSAATYLFFEQRHRGERGSMAAAAMALGACSFLITLAAFVVESILPY